jgi:hypothetical protein
MEGSIVVITVLLVVICLSRKTVLSRISVRGDDQRRWLHGRLFK